MNWHDGEMQMQQLTDEEIKYYKRKFYMKKSNANRHYGYDQFNITFEEWLDVWQQSGHLKDMGSNADNYVLSRKDLTKPLSVDNCLVTTKHDVILNRHKGVSKNRGRVFNVGIKRSEQTRAKQSASHKGARPVKTGTPIQTPKGLFPNIHAAAEHFGVNVTAIHYFKRKYPSEYYYVI